MKLWVYIASFHILSLSVFQGGFLAEIARSLILIEHYHFHEDLSDEPVGFLDFIQMHYGKVTHAHDNSVHDDLPLHVHSSAGVQVLFSQPLPDLNTAVAVPEVKASNRLIDEHIVINYLRNSIFHPPKGGLLQT